MMILTDINIDAFDSKWPLKSRTCADWLTRVNENFNVFLADHASNERKAAALAMEFISRYPDKPSLIMTATRIAQEEIEHFRMVFELLKSMNFSLLPDVRNEYARLMRVNMASSGPKRLMDLLMINALIEHRGQERFYMLSCAFQDPSLQAFYLKLSLGEKGHAQTYIFEAAKIFGKEATQSALNEWLILEDQAFQKTPPSPQLFG